jgi:lipopolysaccharide heptosyltransferase II
MSSKRYIKPENLLIVRTDRIGDVILSLPLAGIVKKHYPECKVTFLVRDYTRELVENHPYIDKVLILNETNGKVNLKENIFTIKKFNFDSSVIVYPTFFTSLVVFLSGIKNRIGTGYRWYSFLFNEKIYEHRKYAAKHELEFNVNLLRKFNIVEEITAANVKFDIPVNPDSNKKINEILQNNNIDDKKPVIIIHPGSRGSSIDLPIDKFKELIDLIINKTNFQIILTGSKSERELCEELMINEKVKNFAGEFKLSELISLINKTEIFISNSTGPIHIAAALNKYTIGFYPKLLACSAKRWGPYTTKALVFTPETECEACSREQCKNPDCMKSIQMPKVFAEIEKIHKLVINNEDRNV